MKPSLHKFGNSIAFILMLSFAESAWGQAAWALRPIIRSEIPESTNPINRLLAQAQVRAGVVSSPEADRTTLIRRLSFDLRGLPPEPAEIDAFLNDQKADAYERLVDRLLADPAFGERWAGHWLDLVRYADSSGFEEDLKRPTAWRYRDWVVDAINRDLPYDRFLRLQIAADETPEAAPTDRAALGFLRCGPTVGNERTEKVRLDELDDVISTTSQITLGLNVGCARCHDHKTDAIPTEDYYRLLAVFAPARPADVALVSDEEVNRRRETMLMLEEVVDVARVAKLGLERSIRNRLEAERRTAFPDNWKKAYEAGMIRSLPKSAQGEIARRTIVTDEDLDAALSPLERSSLDECTARIDRFKAMESAMVPEALGVAETSSRAMPVYVRIRGDVDRKGDMVRAGPPRSVAGQVVDFPDPPETSTTTRFRSGFVDRLVDPTNPLTARVEANRLWLGHFGRGLVRTPADFGMTGDAPAVPELLDQLASQLIGNGWSRKAIHKQIVMSKAYRQSSRLQPAMQKIDPDETLVWRYPLRRLDAEAIRDAILSCSGSLNPKRGGPGVFPPIDPGIVRTGNVPRWPLDAADGAEVRRRSLYVFRMRSLPLPMLDVFDAPDTARSCPQRIDTTTPLQALNLLNDPSVNDAARRFADRVAQEAGSDVDARITLAFRTATGRPPRPEVRDTTRKYELSELCHAIFTSNAFLYLD